MTDTDDARSDESGMLRSTVVTGSMTTLSRISGLAREIGFSRWFGAEPVMDAFIIAFKIPNLLRRFFAEGAFSQAFVPVISEYRTTQSPDETRELVNRVTGTLGVVLFAITVVGVIAAPVIIYAFTVGMEAGDMRRGMATEMLRLTFPYLFFISLTALAGAILNSHKRFAAAAFTPVLLNIVLIVFAGFVAPRLGNAALALSLGVFVAGVVQLVFQVPFLWRIKLLPVPLWGWAHRGVRRVLTLMVPILFGSSVAQINILFDVFVASFLASGTMSWLYYSDRLMEFPLGVFGIALATVIMPSLSENHARRSAQEFSQTIDWAMRLVLVIGLPAAVGLMLLAEPMVATIYFGGAFTPNDVAMATLSLQAYAPGLIGVILVTVLAPGFFARQDARTPVRIAVRALLLGMALNVGFVVTLARTGWLSPHTGLAAATSCSAFLNAALLFRGLKRAGVYRSGAGWGALAARAGIAAAAMSAFIVWFVSRLGDWLEMSTWQRIGWLSFSIGAAMIVYFAVCLLVGMRPRELRSHSVRRSL
jgi:putative peptidoglycan lipid II flippase